MRAYNIFLLACMSVISKDVPFITMDVFSAVSCNFFNLLYASLCSEDNSAFFTERDSSTLSSHVRCTHIFVQLKKSLATKRCISIYSDFITSDSNILLRRIVGEASMNCGKSTQSEIYQYIRSTSYR